MALSLEQLEKKLDEALGKETAETLREWLTFQRQNEYLAEHYRNFSTVPTNSDNGWKEQEFQWTDEKVKQFAEYILSDGFHVQTTPKMAAEYYFQLFKDFLSLTKPEPKRDPLFVTEDGVEIMDNSQDYFIVNSDFKRAGKANGIGWYMPDIGNKYFSTEDAAEQYIRDNKPSISYRQLEDHLNKKPNGLPNLFNDAWDVFSNNVLVHFKPK